MILVRAAALLTLIISLMAFWATLRAHRAEADSPTDREKRRGLRLALLAAGPAVFAIAFAFAQQVLWPVAHEYVRPLIPIVSSWPERTWYEEPVQFVYWLIAVGGTTLVMVLSAGALSGRAWPIRPLDGYWLANPLSIALGYALYHVVAGALEPDAGYRYWGATMWVVQVVLAAPVFAWVFQASTRRGWKRRAA